MGRLHVRIVGGSCGNSLYLIADHLEQLIIHQWGYDCLITVQNIWESFGPPPRANLILQTMPAYKPSESECPVLFIKRLLIDRNHPPTIHSIQNTLIEICEATIPSLETGA